MAKTGELKQLPAISFLSKGGNRTKAVSDLAGDMLASGHMGLSLVMTPQSGTHRHTSTVTHHLARGVKHCLQPDQTHSHKGKVMANVKVFSTIVVIHIDKTWICYQIWYHV